MYPAERRSEPRFEQLHLTSVQPWPQPRRSGPLAIGRTRDLSRGGMRLELREPVDPGSTLEVRLALGEELLDLSGSVRYLERSPEGLYQVGLQFAGTTPETRQLLEHHLARVRRNG